MDIKSSAKDVKAWPFIEAQKLLNRYDKSLPANGSILFQTGYGPSGLPHIGTFGEVVRTSMVRSSFHEISDIKTRLFTFSDDMDALRKVPENIPNQELIQRFLGMPLTQIPDPYNRFESFGHHNNYLLCEFLDNFGFDYEFKSSTEFYKSGKFDKTLLEVLKNYDKIIQIILPTLGKERRKTYSPFLPLCSETGSVLQVPVIKTDYKSGTIIYEREDGKKIETLVTGGECKLQWKVDWAMRWKAFEVDYEMSGKDLIESVNLSSKICKIIEGNPPEGFNYELFLDDKGEKISKSRGNGISIEQWLKYASPESLSLFMFQSPRKAKRLYFDVIPKAVNEYYTFLKKYDGEGVDKYNNPVWYIHNGAPPKESISISFNLLLNLVSVCNTEDPKVLWGFINRYEKSISKDATLLLDDLILYAINYYRDFVKPYKNFRLPTKNENLAMEALVSELQKIDINSDGSDIQNIIYKVGKEYNFENLRDWFGAHYEVLFGQKEGPRIGSFVTLYGIDNYINLIKSSLSRDSKE
ncbi:lysine--tRNA ligase [Alphaproteobacteria bacterium]|nr:lysine--tRNA ligase [Alphaproteobacteria bacterium]